MSDFFVFVLEDLKVNISGVITETADISDLHKASVTPSSKTPIIPIIQSKAVQLRHILVMNAVQGGSNVSICG